MADDMTTQQALDKCTIEHLREGMALQRLDLGHRLEDIQRLTREVEQFIRISSTWTEHPKLPNGENYAGPCACQECCAYG